MLLIWLKGKKLHSDVGYYSKDIKILPKRHNAEISVIYNKIGVNCLEVEKCVEWCVHQSQLATVSFAFDKDKCDAPCD